MWENNLGRLEREVLTKGHLEVTEICQAANGDWMLNFRLDNGDSDWVWLTKEQTAIIQAVQRMARNQVRSIIKKALEFELERVCQQHEEN